VAAAVNFYFSSAHQHIDTSAQFRYLQCLPFKQNFHHEKNLLPLFLFCSSIIFNSSDLSIAEHNDAWQLE